MAGVMNEADWEQWTLDQLAGLDWQYRAGRDVAPGSGERESWRDIVLLGTLRQALENLNPEVPIGYLEQAMAEVVSPRSQDAITENFRIHDILVNGYRGITYTDHEGREVTPTIRFVAGDPVRNKYHAVSQVTVRSREHERRFDVVLYLNGLPVSIIELKQAGSLRATSEVAYNQLQTYLRELPMAFRFANLVVASDGVTARYGTPFTPWNHFAPWNVDDDGAAVEPGTPGDDGEPAFGLDLLLPGVYNVERFGQLLRDFTAYDESDSGLKMRLAKPHQYFAVTKAVASTVVAVDSDGRAGVVWHTQGSGKSMEMELYTAKVMRHPRLANPTVVVLTDRTELDSQLFDGFKASTLLPEQPKQVGSREELRTELAQRRSGGIYFTTLQKFGLTKAERNAGADHPLLSDRRNVIVIADEAHRSHYDDIDGYARHLRDALPHATLIAFTGTPIREAERDTRKVFGDDIDVYDLHRAVADGATVPVLFEQRMIDLERVPDLTDEEIDDAAETDRRPRRRGQGADPARCGGARHRVRRTAATRGAGPRPGDALGSSQRGDGPLHRRTGQGDGRLRHSVDRGAPVRRDRHAAAGLARRRRRQGQDQSRVHRGPGGARGDHQASPEAECDRGGEAAHEGPRRRPRDGDRQGHDAHRVRRSRAAHLVRRPAAQGRPADADAGAGEPHVSR